jgi:hypothetical protein
MPSHPFSSHRSSRRWCTTCLSVYRSAWPAGRGVFGVSATGHVPLRRPSVDPLWSGSFIPPFRFRTLFAEWMLAVLLLLQKRAVVRELTLLFSVHELLQRYKTPGLAHSVGGVPHVHLLLRPRLDDHDPITRDAVPRAWPGSARLGSAGPGSQPSVFDVDWNDNWYRHHASTVGAHELSFHADSSQASQRA